MKKAIKLDGSWQAAELDTNFGDWSLPESLTPSDAAQINVQIPGAMQASEDKQWWYKRTFDIDEDFIQLSTYLEIDGIDTHAAIFINGEEICRAEESVCKIDVGKNINVGRNTIALRFDPSPCVGILRGAALVSYDAVSISDLHIETELEGGYANAWITLELENYSRKDKIVSASIVLELGEDREKIEVVDEVSAFGGIIDAVIRIEEPLLWWPNGFGEHTLYKCMAGIQVDGEVTDVCEKKFGVRDIKLVEQSESGAQQFTFMVNGQDIFCKGANWLPDLGTKDVRDKIKLAADANFNMFKVSGGDIYDSPEFYDACDEMGIMLWHDLSSSDKQLTQGVKKLRTHPSIVAWSGTGVSETLKKYDHYRLFVPSPDFFCNTIRHCPQNFGMLREIIETVNTPFALDLGVKGMPSVDVLKGWMGEWNDEAGFVNYSYLLQSEILKAQIERFRRDKWAASGALLREFLEKITIEPSGLVQHDGRPKPAYYYAKHAFAPTAVLFKAVEDRVQVYLNSDDRFNNLNGRLGVGVFSFDSNAMDLKSYSVMVEANSSKLMWESEPISEIITDPQKQCLIALFEVKGKIVAQNVYFLSNPGQINFPQPKLLVSREQIDGTHHRMDLAANAYARNVVFRHLPPQARPSDNYFDMLPGEHYQITIDNITEEQAKKLAIDVLRR